MQQALRLQQQFPEERAPRVRAGALSWSVSLQPTPLSLTYRVAVRYRQGQRPRVTVVSPRLDSRPDELLPHVYPGEELCLYYGREFVGTEQFIADTIVPWASEWLYFYEHWMSTGVWLGAEAPHAPGTPKV